MLAQDNGKSETISLAISFVSSLTILMTILNGLAVYTLQLAGCLRLHASLVRQRFGARWPVSCYPVARVLTATDTTTVGDREKRRGRDDRARSRPGAGAVVRVAELYAHQGLREADANAPYRLKQHVPGGRRCR